MKEAAHNMLIHKEDLAMIMSLETGKPFSDSVGEVLYAANYFSFYSEEVMRDAGRIVSSFSNNREMRVERYPIGVCSLITPWNFPSAMITRKVRMLGLFYLFTCMYVCMYDVYI